MRSWETMFLSLPFSSFPTSLFSSSNTHLVPQTKTHEYSIFGVFDGHGGIRTAEYLSVHLHFNILSAVLHPEYPNSLDDVEGNTFEEKEENLFVSTLKQVFVQTNENFFDHLDREVCLYFPFFFFFSCSKLLHMQGFGWCLWSHSCRCGKKRQQPLCVLGRWFGSSTLSKRWMHRPLSNPQGELWGSLLFLHNSQQTC